MAKSSLKPGAGSVSETPTDLSAPASAGAMVPYQGDQTDYDSGARDRITPKLGLVNATGPLATKFRSDYGKYVYADRLILGDKVLFIPLRLDRRFVACKINGVKLKHTDDKPIFANQKAANEAGFAIDIDSNHPNQAEPIGTVTGLVEGPADDPSGDFFIEVASLKKFFAPVIFTVRRGGYRDVFRQLYTAEDRAKMQGRQLWHGVWQLFVKPDCKSEEHENTWAEPRIVPHARLSAADAEGITAAASKFAGKVAEPVTTD